MLFADTTSNPESVGITCDKELRVCEFPLNRFVNMIKESWEC